jgi:Zn-finger nucleic acid-binding protein
MHTCPACKSVRLQQVDLEPGLKAHRCPQCRGEWIPFADYLPWVESGAPVGAPAGGETTGDSETPGELFVGSGPGTAVGGAGAAATATGAKVKLCPECGRFLRRYGLGMGIEFEVERCGGCAGVWSDRGKWPRLRDAGAHARLHLLFSDAWQTKLKEEQIRKRQEDRVRSILGDEDFERARLFKEWVDSHRQRATLRAFLAEDFGEKAPPSTR